MFFRGSRALGGKHQALLDFRGRDRWLIDGNQSIDVTLFFARTLLQGGSMTRRFLISSLAVGLLALGGLNAQASNVPLPQTLAALEGNSTIQGNLEFSNFTYTATPLGSPPPASGVTVSPFSITGETGITFNAPFFAAAGTTVDYAISYTVTALSGSITNAYLSLTGGNFNGNGSVSVAEGLFTTGGTPITTLEASLGSTVATATFSPATTIEVKKDIFLNGGSMGATVSFVDQGYSTTTVIPEPASMALLGIGLSGLFTLRRLFRRTSGA